MFLAGNQLYDWHSQGIGEAVEVKMNPLPFSPTNVGQKTKVVMHVSKININL